MLDRDDTALIERYRDAHEPQILSSSDAWSRLAERINRGEPGPPEPSGPAPSAASTPALRLILGGMVGVLVAGLLVQAGVRQPADPQPLEAAASPTTAADAGGEGHGAEHPVVEATPISHPYEHALPPAGPRLDEPHPRADRLAKGIAPETPEKKRRGVRDPTPLDEVELIAQMKRALSRGEPGATLRLARKHRASFPNGALVDERRLLRMQALCAAGQEPRARAEIRAFLREAPTAAIAARVRGACPDSH